MLSCVSAEKTGTFGSFFEPLVLSKLIKALLNGQLKFSIVTRNYKKFTDVYTRIANVMLQVMNIR